MRLHQLTLGLLITILLPTSTLAGQLQAGAATSNITPELGREIIGGFVPFPSSHIHDELHARCLVLDDGQTRLALVVCDLLGIDRIISEEARRQIAEQYEIPREHVLISATHTHSAASALGKDPRKLSQTIDDYQQFVAQRIADGVARAINNLQPAEIAFGIVDVPEHVHNRRWHMRPGSIPANPFGGNDLVKMNPPRANDNLVEPAGPTDPTVSFLSIRQPDGQPISIYAAYSLHYVGGVGRGYVSADYFAVFSEHIGQLLTSGDASDVGYPPFVAMMANGTSGDINNINFREWRPRKEHYEQMRFVGRDVAEKVHAKIASLSYERDVTLAAAYREPAIAWRQPTAEQRQWAEDTIAAGRKNERDLSFIYAERTMRQAEYPEATTVPLHVLRIGDVCIGTMPFEVFCEIGLDFKDRCPIESAFMVELAHGYFGYLPTPRQHEFGGYETWLGTNRVEREASVKLLDMLLEMATEVEVELEEQPVQTKQ
jgi:neutral ceramidase